MGCDFLVDQIEKVQGINWLEFSGITAPIISMISVEQQFAEKLHAYTLPCNYINSRSKDLIDLLLLLKNENRSPEGFKRAIQRVFRARNTHSLPTVLSEPPISWRESFAKMATDCGITHSLMEGFTLISEFYNKLQAFLDLIESE